jgi:hypothetical protein
LAPRALQRSLFDKSSGASRYLDSKIATLEFKYKPNLAMSEEDRLLNPLGFRVSAYRVDNDYSAAPSTGDDSLYVANRPPLACLPSRCLRRNRCRAGAGWCCRADGSGAITGRCACGSAGGCSHWQ